MKEMMMDEATIDLNMFFLWKTSLWMNNTLFIKINKSVNKDSLFLERRECN